ncbi:hypothetical protein JCM5296_002333 [Sporobolomyces johnsonii]
MDSPIPSPGLDEDNFASPPPFPFPSGTYTFLPQVDKCDNLTLPTGPWEAADCKRRWEQHCANEKRRKRTANPSATATNGDSSALTDEDEDEESVFGDAKDPAQFEHEFLAPFFLELPEDHTASSAPSARARRRSSTRQSFTRLTPLPSLRPSSPTSSHPSYAAVPPPKPAQSQPIGFLRPSIVRALIEDNKKLVDMNLKPVWSFLPPISFPPPNRRPSYGSRPGSRRHSKSSQPIPQSASAPPMSVEQVDVVEREDVLEGLRSLAVGGPGTTSGPWAVGFEDWVNEEGPQARREHIDRVVRGWKMAGQFKECLGGWRDEEYSIYGPAPPLGQDDNPLPGTNVAFSMERSACALFGVATFGVHCTAYVEEESQPLKFWIPRRSATKQTWPSYLDNTVAGGITAGDLPGESILRECAEEASLAPSVVGPRIKQVGVITYNYRTAEGWLQPEVQYCYDLRLPAEVVPTPSDGEAESFELMELDEVVRRMCDGEFKPNCALVLIDFFIRHGLLTAESDARFLEVATRLHRPLSLPGPA